MTIGPFWGNLSKSGTYNFANIVECDENEAGGLYVREGYHEMVKSSEILQCFHHSFVYGSSHGILLLGDKRDYIGSIITRYPKELFDAYIRYLYEQILQPFYAEPTGVKQDQIPTLPNEVYEALKSDALKHLKVSDEAFNCFFGLWYQMSVASSSSLPRPYPKIARIVPISVAKWNTLKGGGDAITKLIDSCRECI